MPKRREGQACIKSISLNLLGKNSRRVADELLSCLNLHEMIRRIVHASVGKHQRQGALKLPSCRDGLRQSPRQTDESLENGNARKEKNMVWGRHEAQRSQEACLLRTGACSLTRKIRSILTPLSIFCLMVAKSSGSLII